MVAPVIIGSGIVAGAGLLSSALNKPSESQSGMDIGQKQYVKQQNWWSRRRQAENIKDRSQQMLGNQMLGGQSLLGLTQAGIQPRIDLINQGYGTAASRLQGGLLAGSDILRGNEPDYGYMGPRDIDPDISYLEDYRMPEYDTSAIKEWMPSKEARENQNLLLDSGGKEGTRTDFGSTKTQDVDLAKYGAEG